MPESRLTAALLATPDLAMRWDEDGVVHEVMKFWDDDYPEIVLRCGRSPNDSPTMGENAKLPAVSCLLCLMRQLEDEEDIPW